MYKLRSSATVCLKPFGNACLHVSTTLLQMTKYSFSCLNHHKTAAYLHFLFLVAVLKLNETFVRSGPLLFASFRVSKRVDSIDRRIVNLGLAK